MLKTQILIKNKNITIGIVGHGRFGSLVEKIIKEKFPNIKLKIFEKDSNFAEINQCNVVIVAVPISSFEEATLQIKDFIQPNTLLMDVCSVKIHPVKVMLKHLPLNIDIIATHPMFGPDSVKNGLKDLRIVIHKTRCTTSKFKKIIKILESFGLIVVQMKPEDHDRLIARSQVFTHIIGRVGDGINIKSTSINTATFEKLLEIQKIITSDTFELFRDMNLFNPFAKDIRTQIKTELDNLERQI